MVKTKKKEVQKQGLRPSQKAKAEKLRQKHEAKVASTSPSLQENIVDKTEQDVIIEQSSNKSQTIEPVATITVKNADGDPDTEAQILIQNKIDYTPKVSVVMPVYNVEPYLRQCLDSVTSQTLKEIEIICVDDGSTDASLDILKEYAAKDNRITVITQKNLYAGVARNAGLSQAKGEYLSFLDSDDFFELNMLEISYNKAIYDNSDVVIFRYIKFDCKTNEISKDLGAHTKILRLNSTISASRYADKVFQITCPMPWNKIYKREYIEQCGLKYQGIRVSNDLCFVFCAVASAQRISYIPYNFVTYRIFKKNSLSGARSQFPYLFLDSFIGLRKYINKIGYGDLYTHSFYEILYNSIKWTANQQEDPTSFYNGLEKLDILPKLGVNSVDEIEKKATIKRNLYISLTSYPARIDTIHLTIESLLNQSMKADKILLWLAPEQFPNKENDLPKQLINLIPRGLQIEWYKDVRSYKKLIPALQKYPEAIIVTADDDIIYPENWLSLLYKGYQEEPYSINCHRSFRIRTIGDTILPYSKWNKGKYLKGKGTYGTLSDEVIIDYRNFYTSGSGALYPPHILHEDVLKEDLFTQLAPTEDDVWYWAMAVHNDVPIHVVKGNLGLFEDNVYANQEFALYNINNQNDTTNKIFGNIFNYFPDIKDKIINDMKYCNLNAILRQKDNLIVSLTSYPARINTVSKTIETLLDQSLKADGVILWLAPEQFPNKEADLPQDLLDLRQKGLIIDWYHDIRSYKKLIPTLKKYPESIIVTADDDALYEDQWLERLYLSFLKDKKSIHCHRAHKIILNNNKIAPYNKWEHITCKQSGSFSTFFTGLGGVLYPPHCLSKEVCNEKLFMKLCPQGDDIWFWGMALLNNTKITVVEKAFTNPILIDGTQETALWITNVGDSRNDEQIKNIVKEYPKLLKIVKKEQNKGILNLLKTYVFFPYYFIKIKNINKQIFIKMLQRIALNLMSYRIDIKNLGSKNNNVVILPQSGIIEEPKWFVNEQGVGKVLQGNTLKNTVNIKAVNDGTLRVDFRGQDRRYNDKRFPLWIDYKSIKIDGKQILSAPISVWHDKPYRHEIPVKDGQEISLEVEQQYHEYTENELKDVIMKLNQDNKYIEDNIVEIIRELGKQFVIDETEYKKRQIDKIATDAIKSLTSYRIDIKNFGDSSNAIDISVLDGIIEEPKWFVNEQGKGKILQGNTLKNTVNIKAVNDGTLRVDFRGQDRRYNDKRFPLWIDYKSIKIDGKQILSAPISVWHDKPYRHEIPVKDGQEISLEVEQQYHEYTENELKDILIKLNLDNDISSNIDIIMAELKKQLNIIDEEIYLKKKLDEEVSNIASNLICYRIDIKNWGLETNTVKVISTNYKVEEPKWFTDTQGIGKVLRSSNLEDIIKLKIVNDGLLKLDFRGQDIRVDGKRIPIWIDYKSVKVDGKEILQDAFIAWYNKPYRYEIQVKDGQEITLEIRQQYHQYSEDELRDLLLKIYCSDSIKVDTIDLLLRKKFNKNAIEHSWNYVQSEVFPKDSVEIDLNTETSIKSGKLKINSNGVSFESVCLNSSTKKMYIFLSAVGNKSIQYPIFHRISWCSDYNGICLYFDDPTRNLYNFAPAYYIGSPEHHYLQDILGIIKRIAFVNNVNYEDITFISSSNGGFAALWLCNELEGSRCYAYCPQIDIKLHRNSSILNGWNLDKFATTRINLQHITKNTKSKFFIYSNINCNDDLKQMELWFSYYNKKLKLGLSDLADNMKMLIVDIDGIKPHEVQPGKEFTSYLINEYYYHQNDKKLQMYIEELKNNSLQQLENNKDSAA